MTGRAFPDPFAPMDAVRSVWNDRRDLVERFALRAEPGGAVEQSYYVLVFCDRDDVNPRELVAAMRELERLVEERSGLDVALTLAMPSESKNGTHN